MATIQSSLQLYDGMSPVLRKITNAMNIAISSFEDMSKAVSYTHLTSWGLYQFCECSQQCGGTIRPWDGGNPSGVWLGAGKGGFHCDSPGLPGAVPGDIRVSGRCAADVAGQGVIQEPDERYLLPAQWRS